ncbi:tail fiber protein [Gallibacterium anatis]|uniref:tail fiber protein n=1 Tax=Gallibacterium anatis TaxID=750 RepID=UPI0038B4090F
MKLLDLFKTIIWAKNGDTTDFSQTNYEAGWAHLGDDTPTVQDFNYVQQMNDKKDQWLFKQLKAVMENAGIEPTEDNINALLNAILKIAKGHSTPKAINAETLDFVDETGHTHSISKASLTQLGIVQLTNSLDSDSETLGLTAKAGKALKALINALTSNLQNYIPNSKKSNSVTSTSSDTVATSYAAKTAYDKAVAANNNADSRVSKSGGEMTGGLKLKANYGTSEKKWDYSGFYAGSATLNNEDLPYFQIHIGSYGGNTAGHAKSLGFNLTDYKAYVMSWNSRGEYAGKKEILTELHRSDSVTSTRSDTVATSKAVKTAYDKAVDGVNKANAAQTAANNAQTTANAAIPSSKKSDSVTSASSDTVATSKAVKTAYDKAVDGVNKANAAQTAANNAQTTANAAIPSSKKSDSVTSASSDTVATSKAVKTAYDKAVDGVNKANAAQTAANNANNNANKRVLDSVKVSNLNTLSGSQVFFCDRSPIGAPPWIGKIDFNGIHIDSGLQRFQLASVDYNDLRYRFNDDNSGVAGAGEWSHWRRIAMIEDFTQNLAVTGWCRLPNGLLLQWGAGSGADKKQFPVAFRQVYQVVSSSTCGGDANYDLDLFFNNTHVWGRYQTNIRYFAIGE